jgi:hypothetical protein
MDAPARTYGLYATPHETSGLAIKRWTIPGSLAVTKGILVSFFSSAY